MAVANGLIAWGAGTAVAVLIGSGTLAVRGEVIEPAIRFELVGAQSGSFFGADSAGTVEATVPAGLAPAGPLELTLAAVGSGADATTTVTAYDPATTSVFSVAVQECGYGPHYLILRLPQAGMRGWTHFSRNPPGPPSAAESVTTEALAADYRELTLSRLGPLFDEETSGVWMGSDPAADYHWHRENLYHAVALLATGDAGDAVRANAAIAAVCAAQDRTSILPWEQGLYYTNGTDRRTLDTAVTFFGAPLLARLILKPPAGLTAETRQLILDSLGYAMEYFTRRFQAGHPLDATNFQLLGTAAVALGGAALEDPALTETARQQMQLFYDHVLPRGAPYEYNSPTYCGVTLWALKLIVEHAADPTMVAQARVLEERMWLDLALSHHPRMRHFAGPYSRAFKDIMYGGTSLSGFLLSAETGLGRYAGPGRLAENFDALHSHDINPAFFESTLLQGMSEELKEVFGSRTTPAFSRQRTRSCDTASHVGRSFTLGSSSATVHAQGEGFLLQIADEEAPGGLSPVFARTGATDAEAVDYGFPSGGGTLALQDGGKAIVMSRRTVSAAESPARRALFVLAADERFAAWEDMRINNLSVSGSGSFGLNDTVFLRRQGVFLAVRPLYAAAAAGRQRVGCISRGDGILNIALHVADGPAAMPLAGARIEAGFAVACVESDEWDSYDAFIADFLSGSSAVVAETPSARSVSWTWRGSMSCEVERETGAFLSRSVRGAPPAHLLADSEFAQQTDGTAVSLRDLHVDGLAPYSWVVYPTGSETALAVNPAETTATVVSNWSAEPVPIAPFGRVRLQRPPEAGVARWTDY